MNENHDRVKRPTAATTGSPERYDPDNAFHASQSIHPASRTNP